MKFEAVHPMAEPDQVLAQLESGQLQPRHLDEPIERQEERIQRRGPALADIHSCSIEHTFADPLQTAVGARLWVVHTVPASQHAHKPTEPSCPGLPK